MEVIAININNLTDARYFAAYMVTTLGFSFDKQLDYAVDELKYSEIINWVEGPDALVVLDGLSIDQEVKLLLQNLKIQKAILGPYLDKSELPLSIQKVFRRCTLDDLVKDEKNIVLTLDQEFSSLTEGELSKITEIAKDQNVYIDSRFTADDLEKLDAIGVQGIIVKGSDEEKVGYKSYDDLDDLFEAIIDF